MRCWLRRWLTALGVGAVAVLMLPGATRADVLSDQPAAILVFPKLLLDSEHGIDTLVRISNSSNQPPAKPLGYEFSS